MSVDERNDPLAVAVKRWAAEARRQEGEHPAPERLAAYAGGGLAEDDAERLRDHLALCRECSRSVLQLRAFPGVEPAADAPAFSPGEVEREWERLWGRVRAAERPAAVPRRRSPASWVPWALAAGLLVTTLGASGWVLALQRRLGEEAQPRTDAILVERTAFGGTARGEPVLARSAAPLLFAVQAAPGREAGGFYWEILPTAGARPVWRSLPQGRPADDRFVLELPPGFLAPGSYRLRLAGRDPRGLVELAVYELRIRR